MVQGNEATDTVLGNYDLVRALLAQESSTAGLLAASKKIRDGQPCAQQYEQWSVEGCPYNPDAEQTQCLEAIGGYESNFCRGRYELTVLDARGLLPLGRKSVSAEGVVEGVLNILRTPGDDANMTTHIEIYVHSIGDQIVVQRDSTETLLSFNGTEQRMQCRPSDAELESLLKAVLMRAGPVAFPCPNAKPIHVDRWVFVNAFRKHRLRLSPYYLLQANRY